MKRIVPIIILALLSMPSLKAFQEKTEIARVNDQSIWADELIYAFQKNRKADSPVNKDSLLNYLDRYINFKLKVQAARGQGTDTLQSFRQEYENYISQVSKPYMDNPNKMEDLVAEAFERANYEVRAAHILIRLNPNASPQDTLAAYQKADSLRTLAKNGIDFRILARQNTDDSNGDRGGDLGWFTVFGMVYPFESGVYNTPVGEVSAPVRTQFGYHLIKVNDKRPARGKIRTSHIFLSRSKHSAAEGKKLIQAAYDSLQAGQTWNQVCQTFTEDLQSKKNNGALPMAGIGQLPQEYLDLAFPIKQLGSYTQPVETPYGWHIIRLDARQSPPDFDKSRSQLAEAVRRSGRLQYEEQEVLKKLKQQNNFTATTAAAKKALDSLKKYLGQVDKIVDFDNDLLFSIGTRKVYTADFFEQLKSQAEGNVRNYNQAYNDFEKSSILAYEDSLALIRYPEYRLLLQEYEEGLLLFDIMEDEVWNKALEDSIGLEQFYTGHLTDYPAPERIESLVVSIRSDWVPDLLDKIKGLIEEALQDKPLADMLKEKLPSNEYSLLKIVKRTFTQEDLPIFASGKWSENQVVFSKAKDQLYYVAKVLPAGYYQLSEIRGKVTANYQDFLDEQWIAQLRQKSKIRIFKKRVASLLPLD